MTTADLHQARLQPWTARELQDHLAAIVARRADADGNCSVLDVALELIGGELEAFLLFGRMGHLDPPRPDGKVAWAVLRQLSKDPNVNAKLPEVVASWLEKQGTS
jgi:hypothetical protein